ncbi:MAG: UDP-4-amino-4,6-dideoxy-N-acetyl-beta-L-altrosamine N-acetyltransferase, partial [Erythrobacter sp.]|nr:UDP-4-amino-4,6-dideoxy-N-acetyl-beta-L-altrosamine N-acetyltransferase [Erythrobacter sp.]
MRNLHEDDLELVRHWRMSPEITRFMYTDPDISPEDQRAWHRKIAASPRDRVWIIELLEGAVPVGLLSLSD